MALSIPHGVTLHVVNIDIPCHQGRCHKFFLGCLSAMNPWAVSEKPCRCVEVVWTYCNPTRRRRGLRAVPVLLGMARRMAVGRADRGRRAVRDDRDDVFEDGDGRVGDGGGGVVVDDV